MPHAVAVAPDAPARLGKRTVSIALLFFTLALVFGFLAESKDFILRIEAKDSTWTKCASSSISPTTNVFGYDWEVSYVDDGPHHASAPAVRVTAKKAGGGTLALFGGMKVFAVDAFLARDGSSAMRLEQRVFRGFGKHLPNGGDTRESLVELAAPARALAANVREAPTLELVVRVRVWNNPLHVVFKDDVLEVLSIVGTTSWCLVLVLNILRALRVEASKHRAGRKRQLMRHEIAHDAHAMAPASTPFSSVYLAASIASAPWRATMVMLNVPLSALDSVLETLADVLVESFNLCWIVALLLMPARAKADTEEQQRVAPHGAQHGAKSRKHRTKHTVNVNSPPRKRSVVSVRHARNESEDITSKRLIVPEETIKADRQRAEREAAEARQHAEAQMRSKAKYKGIIDMRLRDSSVDVQTDSATPRGDVFANIPGLSVASRRRKPSWSAAIVHADDNDAEHVVSHSRQSSAELHARQNSLVHHVLHAIEDLELPPDSKTQVGVPESPKSPPSKSTLDASFTALWDAAAGVL